MEYSIVHNDLFEQEIKPQELIERYSRYLESDIDKYFSQKDFVSRGCPTNKEAGIKGSFKKSGMEYRVSETFGNVYVSPCPKKNELMKFYHESSARHFWLKELWGETNEVRKQKIIRPQMEWTKTFIQQYLNDKLISIAEYYPNQWAYFEEARSGDLGWEYYLVEPMFSPALCHVPHIDQHILKGDAGGKQFDCIYLFEALDRSEDPCATLHWVVEHLKPGGLCFITCLLASGLEIQVLGEASSAFMPPERMNLFSYEGLRGLIAQFDQLQTLEFSTPGVLDIPNIIYAAEHLRAEIPPFIRYIVETRQDPSVLEAFQDFLQMNQLSSFGRLVLRKGHEE